MTEATEFWKKHNYERVITADGSPSLRWLGSEAQETMHHRGGAYSETQQIYGDPWRACLKAGGRSAVSVGLGLGYNEILVAVEALKLGLEPGQIRLLSFEADPILRSEFLKWVEFSGSGSDTDVYNLLSAFFSWNHEDVRQWLNRARKLGSWKLQDALGESTEWSESYECIFYDAFSSKTSPFLWQESFLSSFFQKACASRAWVTTYACTGPLKRALKANHFSLTIRDGFQSKRNSTLGFRDLFSDR